MRNLFKFLLPAVIICVLVCGCGKAPDSLEPVISAVEVEEKETDAVPMALDAGDPDVPETVLPVEDAREIMHYTETDIVMLSKLLYQECGGVDSDTEKACVAWTVLNRVDEYGESVSDVITAPNQFAYYEDRPVSDELYRLAEDVLIRWNREKNGEDCVGRVLPRDYLWFSGDGRHNHFRNAYKGQFTIWDYSLETPYES